MTQQERQKIEEACKALFSGENYKGMYLHLNHLLLSYSTLLAEHNPEFGDISDKEAGECLFTIEQLIKAIEPLIYEDLILKD